MILGKIQINISFSFRRNLENFRRILPTRFLLIEENLVGFFIMVELKYSVNLEREKLHLINPNSASKV